MISQEQFKTKPYKHQIKALEKGWDRSSFALFMEMGTGKSKVLLDNITMLARRKKINFAFIIAPKGVYRNWISKEIPEHFSEDIEHECIFWKSNMNQGEKKYWLNFWRNPPQDKFIIFVMNVEAFSTTRAFKNADVISSMFAAKGLIALDESTTIKNPKAKRTKALLKIASKFVYKRILTGSPVTNSPLDLFSQCEFLGKNMLGFSSYYAFRARYAVLNSRQMGAHSFQQVVGYRHIKELTEKIDKFSFRVLKDECLDLPKKIYTSRYVYMTSVTIHYNVDGVRHIVTGCRGTFALSCEVGAIPTIDFTFTGIYNAPTDTALPSVTYGNQATPLIFKNGNTSSFQLLSFAGALMNFSMDIGNTLVYRELVGGTKEVLLTDRAANGSVTIEAPALASKDYFAAALTDTSLGNLTLTHGTTAGNIVRFTSTKVDIGDISYGEADGVTMLEIPYTLVPSAANNEMELVFT